MTRFPRISAVLLIPGILAAPAIVRGDTISITSGAAMSRTDPLFGGLSVVDVAISSPDHGFSLTAAGDAFGGQYDLYNFCFEAPACMPGHVVSLGALWSGSDFSGTATADGVTFPLSMADIHTGDALARFEGKWTVPEFTGTTTTSVIAPFRFTGFVDYPYNAAEPDSPPAGRPHARCKQPSRPRDRRRALRRPCLPRRSTSASSAGR